MKKKWKWIWIAAACVFLLIALLMMLLQSRFVKRKILSSLQLSLNKSQGIQLIVESFDYNLLKLQFDLKGIQLQKSNGMGLPPVFRAEEVKVNIPLSLIIRRRLRIQEIEIINPEIVFLIDEEGNDNLPFQTGTKKSSQTQTVLPEFLIEHFEVKNAQLNFTDKRNNLQLGLSEIWINGNGQHFGMHSLLLEMRQAGAVSYQNRSFPLERLVFQSELRRQELNVEKLNLALANNEIELSGRIKDLPSLFFDGKMTGNFDLEDLRSLMAIDNPFCGKVAIQASLKGPLKELEAQINLKSEALSYGKIEKIGLSAELSWKDRALEVLSLDLRGEKGEMQGRGILHPLRWIEGNHLNLEWKDLDVEPFMDFIQSPYPVSTKISGTLDVNWKGLSLKDVVGGCDVRFSPSKRGDLPEDGTPLSGRIVANADSGRIDILLQDISILDAVLKGKFRLSRDELSGKIGLEAQSVGKMMPAILAFARNLFENDVQRLGIDGPVSISAALGGNLKEPRLQFSVASADLQVLKRQKLRIDGVGLYDLRSLCIESLRVEDGEESIKIKGFYPLKPVGKNMRFDIQGEALSIQKILETLGSNLKAEGSVQVKARVEGRADNPSVESKWSVSDASLFEMNFDKIEAEIKYQNGRILCDFLRFNKSTGDLEASGFYDLQSSEFRALLSAKSFFFESLKVVENSERISAELDIDLEAYGSLEHPHLKTKGAIRQLSLGGQSLPDLGFEAQSNQDEVLFNVEAPAFSGSIGGAVSLKKPHILQSDLSLDRMRLESLKDMIPFFQEYDVSGLVKADARLTMDFEDPRKSLDCEARIEQVQIRSGARLIQNDSPIFFSFGSETLRVERLQLIEEGSRIKAEGNLSLDTTSSSKILLSADVDLSLLKDFLPVKDIKGSLKIESQLLGSIPDLEVEAEIDLSDTQFQLLQFPFLVEDIQAHFEIDKNIIHIDSFSGRMAKALFGLKGKIPFASLPFQIPDTLHAFEENEAELVLILDNWDPSSLRELVPIQQFRGTVSGRFELGGKKLRPEDLTGKGLFEIFELNVSGVSFKLDTPARIGLERGILSIESLSLRDGENRLNVSGIVDLTGRENLDLALEGGLDVSLLNVFLQEGIFSGRTRFQIRISPSYKRPEIRGFLNIQDGRYQRIFPRLMLEQVNGEINFKGNQVAIEKIQGILNGGNTVLQGKIGFEGLNVHEADIFLKCENSLFDYPKGLHAQVSGDIKFLSNGKTHQVDGTVTILDARYRDDFRVGTAVFNLLKRGSAREALREPNPFLRNLNLDVNIGIPNNFVIDNNIAKAEVSADLQLVGTLSNPSLSGRASVVEGGEVYFNQNTFFIEQATVDFINPVKIEPDLNLSARTQVKEYDIRLVVQGTPEKLTASLVSDPPLSEPNIISLLVMGRTMESASAPVLSVAGSTALSYLNNALTGRIEQATARALGLDSVRIDTGLVSTEENPEARITVGQHLSREFELVFSQDLKDARNQMWMLNYNPYKSFNIQGIKRDNNAFNLALRHEIQFGLKAVSQPVPVDKLEKRNLVVGNIQLEGEMGLPESAVFQSFKLKRGKKIDFAGLQEALDRVRRLYQKNNYLSFFLTARREETNGRLDIFLKIDSGPKIFLEFEGASIPKRTKKEIEETWMGSPIGQLAMEDIRQRIQVYFMEKRYYQVQVRPREKRGEKGERILVFRILKGPRYDKPGIQIRGNRSISERTITAHLAKSRLINSVFYKPTEWVKSIGDLYIRHGYLRPSVQLPVVNLNQDEKKAFVEVSIDEGIRYEVGNIDIKGLRFFEDDQILGEIGIRTGDIVSPEKYNQIDHKIQELYVQRGFNDIRIQPNTQVDVDRGTVDLNIDIQENQRSMVAEIRIEGNNLTSEKIIRRELMFKVGDVLNFQLVNETRKRLYDLGIFERVSIDFSPLEQGEKNPDEENRDPADGRKYYRVVINVFELKPYRLRYGFQYDTDSSFGVLANLVNRNFLGGANLLGVSFRLNRDERDTRAFFRSPYFFSKKISTEIFIFNNRTTKPAFTLDRTGFTLQQQMKIKISNVISYNYTFEKIDTVYPVFAGIQNMDTTDRIGTLNVAFSRDTRDDILNAKRGMFLSQSLRYAPGFVGSKTPFIRYFGQFNIYQKPLDFLIYAASIRIGLGKGFNADLPMSERFFAGGGTTVRGFEKDELGPRDPSTDLPLGGDAVFILNQELRFPIFKRFGGVVFLDLGNVYPKVSDFNFFDVRETAGFGFRLHTPFVLVRFDWGFKLDRRPGESPSKIFFSIGQAF